MNKALENCDFNLMYPKSFLKKLNFDDEILFTFFLLGLDSND